jgi:hypothetical protein
MAATILSFPLESLGLQGSIRARGLQFLDFDTAQQDAPIAALWGTCLRVARG